MVAIKLPIFAGMVPSVDKHLLPDTNAQFSRNVWLYSGALNGMPKKVPVYTLQNPLAQIAYRVPASNANASYLFDSTWLEFENRYTDFITAPVAADSFQRFYWTSTSQQPQYNTYARILAGQPAWLLGVPQPATPIVDVSGGASATIVSRAYVTTLVTEYGEEGPASTPVLVNGKEDATFAITIGAVPADQRGGTRNIKKIRLYRTITSSLGTATYYLLTEVNATGATQLHNDTAADNVIASNVLLESTAWTGPPSLDGFVTMPNGIIAGFKGNELWFSEAYRPHAWPAAYSLTVEHDIIGLGIINQTLVVCTKGNPYTASGVNPARITTAKLAAFEPCLSKGSVVSTEEGVFYTSPNGLILVNPGIAVNVTKQAISRDQWNSIIMDGALNAGRLGSAYIAYGASEQNVFQETAYQEDVFQSGTTVGAAEGFMIDSNSNVGFGYTYDTHELKSIHNDILSGEFLAVHDGQVVWFDQRRGYGIDPYIWRSKVFQTPEEKNFAAFKVFFYEDEEDGIDPEVPPNYDIDQTFDPETQMGVVRVYADDRLILTHELRKSGELHRIPSGFKAHFWYVEFEARIKIKSFQMATSVKELSNV